MSVVTRDYLWPKLREVYDQCLAHFETTDEPFYFMIGHRGGGSTLAHSLAHQLHKMRGGKLLSIARTQSLAIDFVKDFPIGSVIAMSAMAGVFKEFSDADLRDKFQEVLTKGDFKDIRVIVAADYAQVHNRCLDALIHAAANAGIFVLIYGSPTMEKQVEHGDFQPKVALSAWDTNPVISEASWKNLISPMGPDAREHVLRECGGGSPYPY